MFMQNEELLARPSPPPRFNGPGCCPHTTILQQNAWLFPDGCKSRWGGAHSWLLPVAMVENRFLSVPGSVMSEPEEPSGYSGITLPRGE